MNIDESVLRAMVIALDCDAAAKAAEAPVAEEAAEATATEATDAE